VAELQGEEKLSGRGTGFPSPRGSAPEGAGSLGAVRLICGHTLQRESTLVIDDRIVILEGTCLAAGWIGIVARHTWMDLDTLCGGLRPTDGVDGEVVARRRRGRGN